MELNEEQLKAVVNNPESEEDAVSRGSLLVQGMRVGNDWQIHVWKRMDWHYEIVSRALGIKVYPTTTNDGQPRFSADFFGEEYNRQDVRVSVWWEDGKDPNEAVAQLIRKFAESVAASASLKDRIMEKAGL